MVDRLFASTGRRTKVVVNGVGSALPRMGLSRHNLDVNGQGQYSTSFRSYPMYASFIVHALRSDIIVFGGGTIFNSLPVRLMRILFWITPNTPKLAIGVSLGPFSKPAYKLALQGLLSGFNKILLRDRASVERVGEFPNFRISNDLVFSMHDEFGDLRATDKADRIVFALNWFGDSDLERNAFFDQCVQIVRKLQSDAANHEIEVVVFRTCVDPKDGDQRISELLSRHLARAGLAVLDVDYDGTMGSVKEVFARSKWAVASRMHAGVVADLCGCRVLQIAYASKVKDIYWAGVPAGIKIVNFVDFDVNNAVGHLVSNENAQAREEYTTILRDLTEVRAEFFS
ncbi:polysaccharide pyruvyl transferase family protein [Mesorhizobium sp. M1399]